MDDLDPRHVVEAGRLGRVSIDLLPGSGADLRSGAEAVRSTIPALDAAAEAGSQLGALLGGDLWSGQAWAAFEALVDRKPIHTASTSARDVMAEAAEHLDVLGAAHDRHQDELRWIRVRWESVIAGGVTDDTIGALQALEDRAAQIHQTQENAEAEVAAAFDRLDDATTFAVPPPSGLDQFVGGAGSVIGGVRDWAMEAGPTLAVLSNPLLLAPAAGYVGFTRRDDIVEAAEYARDNPRDFAIEFGKEFIDVETWNEDKWRWFGKVLPELGLTALTWGASGAAKGGHRAVDSVDDVVDAAQAADRASDAAQLGGRTSGAATRAGLIPDDVRAAIASLSNATTIVGAADTAVDVGSSRSSSSAAPDDDSC